MRVTPSSPSVSTRAVASCWNSISLPTRRTHSPVEPSRAPRMPKRTPARCRMATKARAIFCPRGSKDMRRADVEQVVQPGHVGRRGDDRHAQAGGPVAALAGLQAPGVALRSRRPRTPSSARAETRRRSSPGAGACGRTCPGARARSGRPPRSSRRWCRPTACPRRSPARPAAAVRCFGSSATMASRCAIRWCLRLSLTRLQRQRLAGQVGRAGVLAAAAFGAGEGVEPFLPVQVERGAHAGLHVGLVGGLHQLVEVDRGHAVGGPAAAEEQRRAAR